MPSAVVVPLRSGLTAINLGLGAFIFSRLKLAQLKIASLAHLTKLSLLGVVAYLLKLTSTCVTGVQAPAAGGLCGGQGFRCVHYVALTNVFQLV